MHMQQVWKMLHLSIYVGYAALQNIYKNEYYVKKSKNISLEIFLKS